MNVVEILIWESANLLPLVPIVIAQLVLMRWLQGKARCGAVPTNNRVLNFS
jgi:hypothetical protein